MHDPAVPAPPPPRPLPPRPRLYSEFASWWPLLDPVSAYAGEAEFYRRALESACDGVVRTVLELGSGGGNNAWHLKRHFELTLVDVSPAMLAVSRGVNPECEHVEGDMRTVRLGRTYDAVFVHDAVAYMTTPAELRAAMATAFAHLRPGGAALFAPDYVRETFAPETSHGGAGGDAGDAGGDAGGDTGGDRRALRYLEWVWDPDPSDTRYTVDFAFLLRDGDGRVTAEHDRHELGVFPRGEWLALLRDVGFGDIARLPHRDPGIDRELDAFVGRRL
jgi:hypothetical protein